MATISRSNSPQVFGLVSMIAATSGVSAARTASAETVPSAPAGTGRTVKPSIAAVAGLVPCAESGASTILRVSSSPRARKAALIAIMPHSSPWAPALGVIATAFVPVSVISASLSASISSSAPCVVDVGCKRVEIGEARQPRHFLVQPRIVFHRAGAERVGSAVDRVVLAAEAHVVAHRLRLGEPGKADRRPCARRRRACSQTARARRYRRR